MSHVDDRMRHCISECHECHDTCLETLAHCLQMGGDHAAPDHVRLMQDCAEICHTSEDFMLRGSDLHTSTCGVCAEVCERCAEDCARFTDDFMKRCAEVCRRCAAMCREMAASRPMAMAA